RRRLWAWAGTAGWAVAVAVALGLAVLPRAGTRPASVPDTVSAAPVPSAPASAVADPTPTRAPDSATALRLVPPAYTVPAFPFRPTVTPVGGLAQPVVTLAAGELSA